MFYNIPGFCWQPLQEMSCNGSYGHAEVIYAYNMVYVARASKAVPAAVVSLIGFAQINK